MKAAIFCLFAVLAAAAAAKASQELDAVALDALQPVADPVPRILQEVLGDITDPGSYGGPTVVAPAATPEPEPVEKPVPAPAAAAECTPTVTAASATKMCIIATATSTEGTVWEAQDGKVTAKTAMACKVEATCEAKAAEDEPAEKPVPQATTRAAPTTSTFTIFSSFFGGKGRKLSATAGVQKAEFFWPEKHIVVSKGAAPAIYSAACYSACA